jgi:O-antigen/teichoic acid export membrane protein
LLAGLGVANYAIREGARIRNDKEGFDSFVNEVFSINILSTVFAYVVLFILILFWRKLDAYISIILVLSTSVAFTTFGADWINVIFEDYEYLTKRYVACHILAIVFLFLMVRDKDDVLYYAASTALGTVSANVLNIVYVRKRFGIKLKLRFNNKILLHIVPILVLFANSIASTIYLNSDVTILGILKDDHDVAIYGVASRIYMMVKGVANAAITVIIPRVASMISGDNKEAIRKLYNKTLGSVILLVIPATVGLIMLSYETVLLIAGSEYTEGAMPLIILSCALPFASSACLLINGILIPYRKEKIALQLTVASALINIVLNFLLIPFFSYCAAAATTLIAEMFIVVGGYITTRKIHAFSVKRELLLSLVSGCLVFLVCKISSYAVDNDIIRIFIAMGSAILLIVVFLCVVKKNIVYDTIIGLKNRFVRK